MSNYEVIPKLAHRMRTACTAVEAPSDTKKSKHEIKAIIMKPISALFSDTFKMTKPTAKEAKSSAKPDAAAITYMFPLREVKY